MARKLKKLKINRVDLVDAGANQESHVVLYKRDSEESMNPLQTIQKSADNLLATGSATSIADATWQAVEQNPDAYYSYSRVVKAGGKPEDAKSLYRRVHDLAVAHFDAGRVNSLVEGLARVAQENPALYMRYQRALAGRS